jgi:ferric-dicitrate binding protein FerR (iron transport regulator)
MPNRERRPFSRVLHDDERSLSDEAIAWFAHLRSNCVSAEEVTAFTTWRNLSPSHDLVFSEICDLWDEPELSIAAAAIPRSYFLKHNG